MKNEDIWTIEIKSHSGLFNLKLKEIWTYRDLLWLFVRRDVITVYKQTILGPLWFIIQPLLTTLMFSLVFGRIARLSTDGIPPFVFYLAGVTIWSYFSECLNKTSNTFVSNQNIFGKVYFPRIIVPGSIIISTLVRFGVQLGIFLVVWIYYYLQGQVNPNYVAVLLPFIVLIMAISSMGFGMLFSSMTTKYRDLQFLLNFAVQLWMYATPIIYPLSSIPEKYVSLIKLNPITPLVECMRFGFLGNGSFSLGEVFYSFIFAIGVFSLGFFVFSRVEKNFMDTV
ncbi:ABC transporter permease [Peredibacter starrii]|uniref:Transport permease protein n=1 Tax=Peredibacter starrii TaxID=28202 RepID=A0AAX4HRM9_9BACT|nr:ABC transporter permease [Peredibacter starrii]WPU65828.1 ABC transporter permease [Peredibacter starrii]